MKRFLIGIAEISVTMLLLAEVQADPESPDGASALTQLDLDAALGGPGTPWSMARIAERAVQTSSRVRQAEVLVVEAHADTEVARTTLLPQTSLGAHYTRLSQIDNDSLVPADAGLGTLRLDVPQNQYALFGRITYPVSQVFLEVLPAIRATQGAQRARRYELSVVRSEVALDLVAMYLGHARSRAALAVAELSVTQAGKNLARAEALLNAQSGTRPEVLRFRARLAEAERELASQRAQVSASANSLRTLLELEGQGPLAIGESLATIPDQILEDDVDKRVALAWKQRAEIAAANSVIRSLGDSFKSKRAGRLPKVTVAAGLDYANPNDWFIPAPDDFRESWNVSLIVAWSPDGSRRASKEADRAQASVQGARAHLDSLRKLIRIEVVDAHTQYFASFAAMKASIRQVEAAEAALEAESRGYTLGLTTAIALLDAEADANRARLALIDAGVSLRLWEQRLIRATGDY